MEKQNLKLAFISAVPFYYQVPLYQSLSDMGIDLIVYFCSKETIDGSAVKKTYGANGNFTKENLLEGYNYKFLKNYSPWPSYLKQPFGLMNFGIWNEIKNGQYDAIILQAWNNIVWLIAFTACMFFGKKVFFMTDSNILEEKNRSFFRRFLKNIFLKRIIFPFSNGFLTSGKSNELFYHSFNVPHYKMMRLPFSWGYEKIIEKAEILLKNREKIRKLLNIRKNDFIFLYVGRISKEKSPETLVGGYNKLKKENKKLFIVGDGPMRADIEKTIKDNDVKNVVITGFKEREKVFEFYAAADVLILPSSKETWGIAVGEAMCFKLPIIVSDKVGSGLDLVEDSVNGYIFKSKNAEDLSVKMDAMISLPKEKLDSFRNKSHIIISGWSKDSDLQVKNILKFIK